MTNLEYIESQVGMNYPIDASVFQNALLGSGVDPLEEYVPGKTFDLAFINLLWSMLTSAERISEGGYTVQLNLDAIRSLISFLYRKWRLPDLTKDAVIQDKTYLW